MIQENTLQSIATDNIFRNWDVPSFTTTSFMNFKDSPITTFETNSKLNQTLTGHIHGAIRLFDLRVDNKKTSKIFKSHNHYISKIKHN